MTPDGILLGKGVTLEDLGRRNVQAASASMNIDCRLGMCAVFTGAVPAGAVMQLPTNAPERSFAGNMFFPAPGTEAIDFATAGWEFGVEVPVHAAGKWALYEWKRMPVDGTPANDKYIITGFVEA